MKRLFVKVQEYKVKKGEVTAFLSITFVLILAFITAILNSAILQTTKNVKRQEVDRALFSIFGEYDPILFEQYDIFAADTGKTEEGKKTQVIDRLHYYGSCDVEHDISGIQFLTDQNGAAFKEQAIKYMSYTYGSSFITDLIGMTEEWKKVKIAGEEIKDKNGKFEEDLSQIAEQENGKEQLGFLFEIKKIPLLSATLPKTFECSKKTVQQQNLLTSRKRNIGKGEFYVRSDISELDNKLLFREYLLKKFSNALSSKEEAEKKELSYEVEYMIGGKCSDKDNLEIVLREIALLRTGANYLSLMKDPKKKAEAEAMAAVLAALIVFPEGVEIICQILLVAWAFSESVEDLRELMNGNRVPLIKETDNWKVSLDSVIHNNTSQDIQQYPEQKKGLEYKDYLRIILFLKNTDILAMKALDRIEGNLRKIHEMPDLYLDCYMTKLRLDNKATVRPGIQYQFPAYFGYN